MKRVMTEDKGPMKIIDGCIIRGTNRRATFRRLEDDTILISYQTLQDKAKRIVTTQSVRLSEQAAAMTISRLITILKLEAS